MTLSRITSTFAAVALGGVVVASTYGAQAAGTVATSHDRAHHAQLVRAADHFQAPAPHKYGANGMRMGLHCEDHDPS
ncbi:MAG TPA: hypothetical protein VHW64_04380 [Nocardioides sp.]|jgi:hypothetical protein|uniref:hypothetical protein n=1 Tax=Nocardioides sp. TaxID=35761 RepID=UPI002E3714B3|nr:hypothetical protein [Nocardioides sp.]HEX3929914.1 hypothetical protein [Nocardioides sp.]